jgi:hypothetical protein
MPQASDMVMDPFAPTKVNSASAVLQGVTLKSCTTLAVQLILFIRHMMFKVPLPWNTKVHTPPLQVCETTCPWSVTTMIVQSSCADSWTEEPARSRAIVVSIVFISLFVGFAFIGSRSR